MDNQIKLKIERYAICLSIYRQPYKVSSRALAALLEIESCDMFHFYAFLFPMLFPLLFYSINETISIKQRNNKIKSFHN